MLKVFELDDLDQALEVERAAGKKIVLCHGVFDLLHPGHIAHFQEARSWGDVLVVTLTADEFVNKGPGRPAFPLYLRAQAVAALQDVQYVGLSRSPSAVQAISKVRPNLYVKGQEYADASQDVTGQIDGENEAVRKFGGETRFTGGQVFSSSGLINRFFSAYPQPTVDYLQAFRSRHNSEAVISHLTSLADLRVLVVGDAIIDHYSYCVPLAKSPRESVLAAQLQSEEFFAGGSFAIANHLAGFCAQVTLVVAMNPNEARHIEFARSHLRANVDLRILPTPDRPTVLKQRFIDSTFRQKLFEIQNIDDQPYSKPLSDALQQLIDEVWEPHDLSIIADFGHGLLTDCLRERLSESPRFLAVNTQTNSANLGFNPISRYRRLDYACIHELELRIATHSKHGEYARLACDMLEQLRARRFMLTRGPSGTVLFGNQGERVATPALAQKVVDRVGAGDSVFSLTAPLLFKGVPDDIVGFVGNCVGALQVEVVCNREPVSPVPLFKFITHLLKS